MMHREQSHLPADWLRTLRRYIVFVAGANLVWEFAHLPFYTIWETGTPGELAFAALHCTGGDILIAGSSITAALCLAGHPGWPDASRWRVITVAVLIGLAYTLFSEWLNIEIRQAWAYRDAMPVLPIVNAGLSPVLQWLIIPLIAHRWATRPAADGRQKALRHA